MYISVRYIVLLLFCTIKLFCQDIIVKRDSSRILSKLLEINPTEIKYKRFDNLEGRTYTLHKSEVAYVIFPNGTREIYKPIYKKTILMIHYELGIT